MIKVERLDKILANSGFGTRKRVKLLIKNGAVMVNNTVPSGSDMHIDTSCDEIKVYGKIMEYKKFIYLMHYKKAGYLTATEDTVNKTIIELMPDDYKVFKPFPVGRLDIDAEGLLLLTNDGETAHNLLSPKKHVDKTYFVKVIGRLTGFDVKMFEKGIDLGDFTTKPSILRIISSGGFSQAYVTIYEGKYHQIKRMFEAVGKKVNYLKRLSMGPLALNNDLLPGGFRSLTQREIELIKNIK